MILKAKNEYSAQPHSLEFELLPFEIKGNMG